MKVRLAKTAGFCMGVRRAMEITLSAARRGGERLYTFGPLIHNPQVLELLAGKNIKTLHEVPAPGSYEGGTIIIRAHGVPPETKEALRQAGFSQVLDGTCPRVIKVQTLIRRAAQRQKQIVIVGDGDHPEVQGLVAHAGSRGWVVPDLQTVETLPQLEQVVVVAQTTQSEAYFDDICRRLEERFGVLEIHNTICAATQSRQDEVLSLAEEVDAVVVVGGRQSANTRRLAELAATKGKQAFLVEEEKDLDLNLMTGFDLIGLTAGASTPNWMIKKIMRQLAAVRSSTETGVAFALRRMLRFIIYSQMLLGLGGAALTMAAGALQGHKPGLLPAAVAFCYLYAMHILNHFLDKEAGQYNDPDHTVFLSKHRTFLTATGSLAGLASLALCLFWGWLPFVLLLLMNGLGLLYSVPVLPASFPVSSVKEIPASKTLAVPFAWIVITVLLPLLANGQWAGPATILALYYVFFLVFWRCTLLDIIDMQGDLIVGRETVPIVLGEGKTIGLLLGLAGLLTLTMLFAAHCWNIPLTLILGLLLPLVSLALMQKILIKEHLSASAGNLGLVDLNLLAAGVWAAIWWLFIQNT